MTPTLAEKGKQKLIPVRVPWQVSPSTPFLRLSAAEIELPPEVTFVAHFGLEHSKEEIENLKTSAFGLSVKLVRFSDLKVCDTRSPYQLVRVKFDIGSWIRMYPAYSDREVIEESAYDWSAILGMGDVIYDTRKYLQNFWQQWYATLLCPAPGMYEVEHSNWLQELHLLNKGYKHYIITGHDVYVETLSKVWQWESLGGIKGW